MKKTKMPTAERRRRKRWLKKSLEGLRYDQARQLMREVFEEMELESPARNKREKVFYSGSEVETLKSFIPDVFAQVHTRQVMTMIIDLMNFTGVRIGAALKIKIADVNIPGRVIKIEKHKGKAQVLTLPDLFANQLQVYLNSLGKQVFLFEKQEGGFYTTRAIQANLKRLREYASEKSGKDFNFLTAHSIRHTFATETAPLMDVRLLAKQLNHSDSKTTEGVYIHQNPLLLQKALNAATLKRMQSEA